MNEKAKKRATKRVDDAVTLLRKAVARMEHLPLCERYITTAGAVVYGGMHNVKRKELRLACERLRQEGVLGPPTTLPGNNLRYPIRCASKT